MKEIILQISGIYPSWEWLVGILVLLVGYLLNKKLTSIESSLIEHARKIEKIQTTMITREEFERREYSWNKEMKQMNISVNQIAVKLNLLNELF